MDAIKTILLYIYCLPFRQLGALVLAGTAVFLLLYCAAGNQTWRRPALLAMSAAYTVAVVCVTLLGRGGPSASHGVSLLPFASYIQFAQGQTEMLRECLMNVVLFYPLGLLLGGAASEKLPRKKLLAFAVLLSLSVELFQGLLGLGRVETDDVIHNTLGAGLGILVTYAAENVIGFVKLHHRRPA